MDLALDKASRLLNSISKLMNSEDLEDQETYCLDITRAKDTVEIIRNQKVLQTKEVTVGVQMLQGHCEILKGTLLSRADED